MLELHNITHRYAEVEVLKGVDLCIDAGEIVCLLGASGSGKSTLLRIVAGLEPLQSGMINLDGQVLAQPGSEPPAESRRFGMVFQDHVLFPHMNVIDNVGFGLHTLDKGARRSRVEEALSNVGLPDFGPRYPHTLSGGQQQRVALARALAPRPRLMLLDEPFASVDSTLRRRLREDTRRALRSAGIPAIVVTHDAEEAMEIADRIAVMDDGQVVQWGTPEEVWQAPVSEFVAALFGGTDAITGEVADAAVHTPFGALPINDTVTKVPTGQDRRACRVIVRPGSVEIEVDDQGVAVVEDIRFLGDHSLVILAAGNGRLRAHVPHAYSLVVGDRVALRFDSGGVLVYLDD